MRGNEGEGWGRQVVGRNNGKEEQLKKNDNINTKKAEPVQGKRFTFYVT